MRRLQTTVDLLDALQERYGWKSDRQIGLGLGIPQQTVSSWRIGRTFPTEVHALTIAKALEIPALMVLAIAAADRTASDESTHGEWSKIVKQLARGGAAALAALMLAIGPTDRAAASDTVDVGNRSYGKSRRRKLSEAA